MAAVIILSGITIDTTTDILQGTRLQTVAAGGALTFELQADSNDPTNSCDVSIQMPGGDTPMNQTRVPGTGSSTVGVIDERENLTASFAIRQGGHAVFGVNVTGTAQLSWRVTFTPA